jgi:hypothetical protein
VSLRTFVVALARAPLVRGALLLAAVLVAYRPALDAGFVWDDDDHVTANPYVVGPMGLRDLWTSPQAVYYPLVTTSFRLLHAVWGLDPFPYHLATVLLHGLCAIALWRVLLRLHAPGAWLGAALWALHPVQVESVAWITELKNTQSGLFYLLAILVFLRARERGSPALAKRLLQHGLLFACAALAVLSKSSTVMLPLVLALLVWWREGRLSPRTLLGLAPLFLLSAAASAWTIWEQRHHSGALGVEWDQTWPERIAIAGKAVWFYLAKLAWPEPLIFVYPRWEVDAGRAASYLPAAAGVAALLALWWGRAGPLRPVLVAYAYFLISLFPVLSFFDVYYFRYSFVADHFQYLASMGPLALAGAAIARVASAPAGAGAVRRAPRSA